MQRFGARSWRTIGFVSALSAMLSSGAAAQSSTTTWGGPVNTDYNIPSNWTRGVPTTDTTAVFGTEPARTTITDIGRGPANIVATWQILAGSPAYTFTMAPLGNYTFNYAGIVNESSVAPTFNVTSSTVTLAGQSSLANANVNLVRGNMLFTSTATAGTATVAMSDGSEVAFAEQATGGQARFILGSTSAIVVQGAATGTDDRFAGRRGHERHQLSQSHARPGRQQPVDRLRRRDLGHGRVDQDRHGHHRSEQQ